MRFCASPRNYANITHRNSEEAALHTTALRIWSTLQTDQELLTEFWKVSYGGLDLFSGLQFPYENMQIKLNQTGNSVLLF